MQYFTIFTVYWSFKKLNEPSLASLTCHLRRYMQHPPHTSRIYVSRPASISLSISRLSNTYLYNPYLNVPECYKTLRARRGTAVGRVRTPGSGTTSSQRLEMYSLSTSKWLSRYSSASIMNWRCFRNISFVDVMVT